MSPKTDAHTAATAPAPRVGGTAPAAETARIHPDTRLGAVHLVVADLEGETAFYTGRLGLKVHGHAGDEVRLGAGGEDLVVLTGSPGARHARGATGLYHVALLVPSRADLARVLAHLVVTATPLGGASDHRVSEALYLSDSEGNGIEVYRDRPRAEWPSGDEPLMATDPLDLDALLAEVGDSAAPWAGLPAGTRVGHVHLRVARLEEAERFYVGVLGFDRIMRYGAGALFVSAGGYHHHIGLNTWAGVGAPRPPAGAAGLDRFVVRLPDPTALERVAERVRAAGVPVQSTPDGFAVEDPSGNRMSFTVHSPGAQR